MLIKKKIKLDIYPFHIHLFYGDTMEEVYESFKKTYNTSLEGIHKLSALAFNCTDADYEYKNLVAILIAQERCSCVISTLHHECIHAASYILDNVGIPMTRSNEPLAYLSEYIFKQCLNSIKQEIIL